MKEIVKTMLKNNVEEDLIIKYTGITKKELNKLNSLIHFTKI